MIAARDFASPRENGREATSSLDCENKDFFFLSCILLLPSFYFLFNERQISFEKNFIYLKDREREHAFFLFSICLFVFIYLKIRMTKVGRDLALCWFTNQALGTVWAGSG